MPDQPARLKVPFIDELGIEFLEAPPGEGRVALDLEPRHLNSWHVAHGGVIMAMLDVAMAISGRALDPESTGGVTVEMKTSFLQPGAAGSRLTAVGRTFHRSSTMAFCDGEVTDADGRLIAKAIGTFKSIRRGDAAARRLRSTGDASSAAAGDAAPGSDG